MALTLSPPLRLRHVLQAQGRRVVLPLASCELAEASLARTGVSLRSMHRV